MVGKIDSRLIENLKDCRHQDRWAMNWIGFRPLDSKVEVVSRVNGDKEIAL